MSHIHQLGEIRNMIMVLSKKIQNLEKVCGTCLDITTETKNMTDLLRDKQTKTDFLLSKNKINNPWNVNADALQTSL